MVMKGERDRSHPAHDRKSIKSQAQKQVISDEEFQCGINLSILENFKP
jgi:hypothetical protein